MSILLYTCIKNITNGNVTLNNYNISSLTFIDLLCSYVKLIKNYDYK